MAKAVFTSIKSYPARNFKINVQETYCNFPQTLPIA